MNQPFFMDIKSHLSSYTHRLHEAMQKIDPSVLQTLAEAFQTCWRDGRHIFLCGNGGSAGNAIHLANDFIYGAGKTAGRGFRCTALPANSAVITCLGNDIGYDFIFAEQIRVLAQKGDILIVLSGSGNSPNILKALEQASALEIKTFAILGYSGGAAKKLADVALHIPVDDMQIAEDLQLVIGHILMQWCSSALTKQPTQAE